MENPFGIDASQCLGVVEEQAGLYSLQRWYFHEDCFATLLKRGIGKVEIQCSGITSKNEAVLFVERFIITEVSRPIPSDLFCVEWYLV